MINPDEHPNCQAIHRFLDQLKLSVPIASTERINGDRVKDGYTAAHMNNDTGKGFTVTSWTRQNGESHFGVYIELVSTNDRAEEFGKATSAAVES